MHEAFACLDVHRAHLRLGAEAVADDRLRHERQDLAHVRIVDAQHGDAIERQPVREFDERLLEPREIVAVGVHVIGVDVRDDFDHRKEIQERRVRLVRFRDDEVARAEPRVRARAVQTPADHEGRIEAARGQHARDERGRRGLAVRAGNRDALLQAHEFREHHGARHDRNAAMARGQHFRIVGAHGGRHHHGIRPFDVLRVMPDRDTRAERAQAVGDRVLRQVRAAHLIAEVDAAPPRCRSSPRRRCRQNECV